MFKMYFPFVHGMLSLINFQLCANVVLRILGDLKPLINDAHEKYIDQQTKLAKRRQQIRTSSPAPPATLKAEQEKQQVRRTSQEFQQIRQHDSVNGAKEEPWDLLKQMEGIKFVSGRPQVQDAPVPRTRIEFRYPTVEQQQQQQQRYPTS